MSLYVAVGCRNTKNHKEKMDLTKHRRTKNNDVVRHKHRQNMCTDSSDETDSAFGEEWKDEIQSLVDNVMGTYLYDSEYTSGLVDGSHDVSHDSSSGIESGEAAHSDTSPNSNPKISLNHHQIQHRAIVHKEGGRPTQQQHHHQPVKHFHNRDPSWSSQTCSDSDIIQGGSLFSSSDTDNNSRPSGDKRLALHSKGKSSAIDSNSSGTTNGGRNRLKGRGVKCKKHVTFQSPSPTHQLPLHPQQGEHQLIDDKRKDNDHFRESNILYYEDDGEYNSDQYYKQGVYHETDLDNPSNTVTVSSYTQGAHRDTHGVHREVTPPHVHYANHKQTIRAKSPYLFHDKVIPRAQTPVSNVSVLSDHSSSFQSSSLHESKHPESSIKKGVSYLDVLPDDIIIRIFSHLPSDQVCRCSAVCRKWYELSWDPTLWTTIKINSPLVNIDKALKHLTRRLSYNTPGVCISVEKINLNGCEQLTDKGLFTIAKRCAELRQLEIQGCVNVSNIAMFEVVSRCVNLEHLNVTGCEMVTCISLTPQATVQAQTYGKQVDLRYLDMSDCHNLEDAGLQIIASYCSQLVYLYLRRCSKVTDIGVQYVANYCHDLKELSISDCTRLTDFGMKELAKLGSKLRYLSVAKCERVTDSGVKYIAKYCHRIRYLNVRGCEGVTDDSLEALSRQCQRLRSLDIGKCDITDEGLQVLANNSPQLKKLSLKSCDAVTDKGIMYVADKCRLLQQLNIQECNITVAAYRMVKSSCKNCIIEHTNPGFY